MRNEDSGCCGVVGLVLLGVLIGLGYSIAILLIELITKIL